MPLWWKRRGSSFLRGAAAVLPDVLFAPRARGTARRLFGGADDDYDDDTEEWDDTTITDDTTEWDDRSSLRWRHHDDDDWDDWDAFWDSSEDGSWIGFAIFVAVVACMCWLSWRQQHAYETTRSIDGAVYGAVPPVVPGQPVGEVVAVDGVAAASAVVAGPAPTVVVEDRALA
eukprot:CAMPEP_0185710106 /NCGR_PEP_ID=MMETSP1164-20130828/30028_1 /TAXON_ID=1104430 /ORGANISM="Chrysoreinhardia sp, Strain CCMP2950" /LENGTH=172 /DNA_ID=CAMNT_0028377611 /DNA_START=16 /DNA_END=531 /DNA_ORIENTATION=-